jgi:conjugative relaxase-like TrwC/TraI family protein
MEMLRITMSVSGEGATKYFDAALATSRYYGSGRGQWGGRGAERLGLNGDVSRKDFIALASNKRPGASETLTVRMKTTRKQKEVVFDEKANTWKQEDGDVSNRRAGYDFCFSVPKSVSLYLVETGDRAVEQMIHESFRETMLDVENRMETRVRGKGEDGQVRNEERTTGNLIYASFVHTETRPIDGIPDPHYHIHAFAFNATFDPEEERWKAGEFGNIKRDAPFYEAAFHARLAEKLLENGFAIRRTDRDFEFASVSRELVEKFSKRTRLIEQLARVRYTVLEAEARDLAKKTGMGFADAFAQVKGKLGAESREAKNVASLTPDEQLANWRAQMTPEERASLRVESVKGTVSQNLLEGPIAKNLALEHLFERASVARELHAAGMLLRRGIGQVSVEEARAFASIDDVFVRPRSDLVTTREVLAEEAALLATVKAAQGGYAELGCGGQWKFLSSFVAGNEEQTNAVLHVLKSRDLVTSIRGPAGSGKTTMMREAERAVAAFSGKDVLVVAPSSSGVEILKQQGFATLDTFQKLMYSASLQEVARGKIVWIDEAGFLSTRQMRWAVDFAARNDCRLILSGDTRQHHAVERGDAMRLMERAGAVAQAALTKIFRQQIAALRDAVYDLSSGKTEIGFSKLAAFGAIHEVEDNVERLEAIANQHITAVREGKSSLIVAPTHAECRAISEVVRDRQKKEGALGGEEHAINRLEKVNLTESQRRDAINYNLGHVVEFHRRAKGGFKSGERWEVGRCSPGSVVVVKNGQAKILPLAQAKSFNVYTQEEVALAVGDSLRITKNFRVGSSRFRNNELCTVTTIDGESITVGGGRVIKRSEPLHLDQGAAVTSHASQGKTVDQVIVSVPVAAFSQTNEAQFYVSMSRARHAMHLYTDSKAALKEAVMRPSERLSPFELLEGIKREVAFVAEMQHARASSKSQNSHRDDKNLVCIQQERTRTTDRIPER